MSFAEAVRSVYGKYATASGRASRSEYWWFQLFLLIALVVWYLAFVVAFVLDSTLGGLVAIGLLVFYLASFLPALGVTVRRLHDSDKSGWWILIAFIPYVGALILLVFMVLSGTPGYNRYGPPPEGSNTRTMFYWGANQWEAWQHFVDDSQSAAVAGFTPMRVDWHLDRGNQYLSVVYVFRPPDPVWNVPSWGPPPPQAG